jgi:hypothetical protein
MATTNQKRITQLEKQIADIRNTIQTQGSTPQLRAERNKLQAELSELKAVGDTQTAALQDEMLAKYGYAYGLIQSDPSLQALFERAVDVKAGVYTAERFAAELRGTDWYKNNTLAKRNYEILRTGDPAEFENKLGRWTEWVLDQARLTGATLTADQAKGFADQIMQGGLDPNKASQVFSTTYIDYNSADLLGRAGALQDELTSLSKKYGNILGLSQVNSYVQQILTGKMVETDVLDSIKRTAASTYTNFSDRIMAGESVDEIADPYKRLMQQYLEVPEVDLQDSLMLDALTGKSDNGGMKYGSLSDFKKAIKSDQRWQYTDNAREEYFGIAQKVLSDFGFLG